jgi:hypothetical protein
MRVKNSQWYVIAIHSHSAASSANVIRLASSVPRIASAVAATAAANSPSCIGQTSSL